MPCPRAGGNKQNAWGRRTDDPLEFVEADLAVLHVDLTVVPAVYLNLARRYPRAINGNVVDISKRHMTAQEVKRGHLYGGPVIVKTNRNSGGVQERLLGGSTLRRMSLSLRDKLPWSLNVPAAGWSSRPPEYEIRVRLATRQAEATAHRQVRSCRGEARGQVSILASYTNSCGNLYRPQPLPAAAFASAGI